MSKANTEPVPLVPVFKLGGTGTGFESKSKDVFGVLQTLEDKHSAVETARQKTGGEKDVESLWKIEPQIEPDLSKANKQYKQKPMKGDNSVSSSRGDDFKKPYSRQPYHRKNNRHSLPDFKKHPESYTCYSLGDVSSSDMSQASNSRAAFDFLEERRRLREQEEEGFEEEVKVDLSDTACSKGVFTFKKRNSNKMEGQSEKKEDKSRETTLVELAEEEEEEKEEKEEEEEERVEKTNFKHRKSKQKNLRVREETEDND